MDHDELRREMNQRFDRLEVKLDEYSIQGVETKQDVTWLKGYIKTGTAFLVSIITAIIIQLLVGKA